MDLNSAEVLALTLIEEHCPEYSFKFDNAKKRFGCCNMLIKQITLSKKLVELNTYNDVKNTILHEIAHAISPIKSHHDYIWKKNAISLGCDGQRVYSNINKPTASYVYECPSCGNQSARYKRTDSSACGVCCRKFNHGKYTEKYKLILKTNYKQEYQATNII